MVCVAQHIADLCHSTENKVVITVFLLLVQTEKKLLFQMSKIIKVQK